MLAANANTSFAVRNASEIGTIGGNGSTTFAFLSNGNGTPAPTTSCSAS